MTLPAHLCPPIWLINPTCAAGCVASERPSSGRTVLVDTFTPTSFRCRTNSECRSGPIVPQRESLELWPQIRIRGFRKVVLPGGVKAPSTRVRVFFCEVERASCIGWRVSRSEEHTSELQSQSNLVCRLLLEK